MSTNGIEDGAFAVPVGLPSSSMKGLKGSRGMMLSELPTTASLVEARLAGREGRARGGGGTCQDRPKTIRCDG